MLLWVVLLGCCFPFLCCAAFSALLLGVLPFPPFFGASKVQKSDGLPPPLLGGAALGCPSFSSFEVVLLSPSFWVVLLPLVLLSGAACPSSSLCVVPSSFCVVVLSPPLLLGGGSFVSSSPFFVVFFISLFSMFCFHLFVACISDVFLCFLL